MGIVAMLRGRSSVAAPGVERATEAAAALMSDRRYSDAVVAYRRLGEAFPELRGHAELQRGLAFAEQGQHSDALSCFATAREFGADLMTVDETVWDTCERESSRRYAELCPLGAHARPSNS